jgi:hypothetical protein
MNKARIRIDGLAALVYWPDGAGFSKTALIAPGLPYDLAQDRIVPVLTASGFGVIQPQYIGTYDSDGFFTPQGCIETLLRFERLIATHDRLYDIRGERYFNIGPRVDVLSAHSFGTYSAVGALLRGLRPSLTILMSPMFEFGAKRAEVGLQLDVRKHVRHIANALPLTFRMKTVAEWEDFFLDQTCFHPRPNDVTCPSPSDVFVICGDADTSLQLCQSVQYVRSFCESYKQCLHLTTHEIVAGGTHDVSTLLTPEIVSQLDHRLMTISKN